MNEHDNHPKIFRKQQIADFIHQMDIASTFTGPDNTLYHDEYINLVMEEVQASESDLTDARVAIEQYVISNLAKEPDNVMFMRLHDAIQPIIQSVIDIEIKMYGSPKYIVSKANKDASAWRIDGGASTPIQNISLPTDVAAEVQKYSFTTLKESDIPTLPEKEDDINERRRSFFKALETTEGDPEVVEDQWLVNFEKEVVFDFLDKAIYAANFHDQVSIAITSQLLTYCTMGEIPGTTHGRNKNALAYERECAVPEVELTPDEFITAARDASLRALFTVLMLSEPGNDALSKSVYESLKADDPVWEATTNDQDVTEVVEECIKALIKLYGKHPIHSGDVASMKMVFQAVDVELRNHFYTALNDWASYYDERHFYNSAANCYLLKEYLANMEGVVKEPKVQLGEVLEKTHEVDKTPSKGVVVTTGGIYIE